MLIEMAIISGHSARSGLDVNNFSQILGLQYGNPTQTVMLLKIFYTSTMTISTAIIEGYVFKECKENSRIIGGGKR